MIFEKKKNSQTFFGYELITTPAPILKGDLIKENKIKPL